MPDHPGMHIAPPASVSALAGLTDARDRLDTAAHNIANANTEPFAPLRPDGRQGEPGTQDLGGDIVGSMQATILYGANLRVIRTDDAMRSSVVDLLV
jgi:flagellar basal body rod protein FlgG